MKFLPAVSTASRARAPRRASVLVFVLTLSALILFALAGVARYVSDMNRLTRVKWHNDQAEYYASQGLAHLLAWLQAQPTPPVVTEKTRINEDCKGVPSGVSYALDISPVAGAPTGRQYLIESTASYFDPRRDKEISCRVQMQVMQTSFAMYEHFVDLAPVWVGSTYMKEFQDFGTIGLGPIHSNSGANIFSSCLFAKPVTSGAPAGARFYDDLWDMYYWVRNHRTSNPPSQNYVHVAGPQANLGYPYESVFYGGLITNLPEITIPGIGNDIEERTRQLRENADFKFPEDDDNVVPPSADAYPKGSGGKYMYTIECSDPGGGDGNGQFTVKQYLGWLSADPTSPNYKLPNYRTVGTYSLGVDGSAILVKGDIIGLRGTIDGRLTVAAMDGTNAGYGPGGDIYITGELQYESREGYSGGFQFPDRDQLAAGGQLNETYYTFLENQVMALNDILGICADGNVLVPEGADPGGAAAFRTNGESNSNPDFTGGSSTTNGFRSAIELVAANGSAGSPSSVPTGANAFFVDGIVMSTGWNGADKSFGAVNPYYRKHGWIHTLGGITTLQTGAWNLFTGSSWTGGLQRYKYWDMRMTDPALAPPMYPLTGGWTVVPDTWRMDFV